MRIHLKGAMRLLAMLVVAMLPTYTVDDPGNATAGNPVTGPFTGPLTIEETQTTFLTVDEDIELEDAVNSLNTGGAPTKFHQLRIGVGNSQNIVAVLNGSLLNPANMNRRPPKVRFFKGETIYFTSDQQSATAEVTVWVLSFTRPGGSRSGSGSVR